VLRSSHHRFGQRVKNGSGLDEVRRQRGQRHSRSKERLAGPSRIPAAPDIAAAVKHLGGPARCAEAKSRASTSATFRPGGGIQSVIRNPPRSRRSLRRRIAPQLPRRSQAAAVVRARETNRPGLLASRDANGSLTAQSLSVIVRGRWAQALPNPGLIAALRLRRRAARIVAGVSPGLVRHQPSLAASVSDPDSDGYRSKVCAGGYGTGGYCTAIANRQDQLRGR